MNFKNIDKMSDDELVFVLNTIKGITGFFDYESQERLRHFANTIDKKIEGSLEDYLWIAFLKEFDNFFNN